MFFKALNLYRIKQNWLMTPSQLADQFTRRAFRECGPNDAQSIGWVPPLEDGELVYHQAGRWLVRLRMDSKILPASVVNAETKKRCADIEKQQGYYPGRKQAREIKERVIDDLLPRSHVKQAYVSAMIDPVLGLMLVDTASDSVAETLIEAIRICLDEFPLLPFNTALSPASAMADWLSGGEAPDGFTIDRDCELKSCGEEKSVVKFVRHPLEDEVADEIKAHLAAGKLPASLAMTWEDRISFVLTEKMTIKRLAFLDVIKEQAESGADTASDQFNADFALMTGELVRFLPDLAEAMGGISPGN